MKRIILILICVISMARWVSASSTFSYTATAAPGATPDGMDRNSNSVDVWTVIATPGGNNGMGDNYLDGSGVYFGNPDGAGGIGGSAENSWQEYSYESDGLGLGGSVDATNQFTGGSLEVGQTVSINFVMRSTDPSANGRPPGTVGISLLSGASTAIEFYIYGGGPDYYLYTDAGSTAADAGPMTYQYQEAFNIAITVTGPNTYTAIAGSDSWSGTFNGPLTGIDVFNHAGGNNSDVGFNNLAIMPEINTYNVFPNDNTALFNATNTFTFSINSPASPVFANSIQLVLNGSNVSSNLFLNGVGTGNVTAVYTNLLLNEYYTGQIMATNQAGTVIITPVRFDTFSPSNFIWEAEDFDFNGGQFIDNSVLSTNSPESYYDTIGVSNVDEYVVNYSSSQPHLWRSQDAVSTLPAQDTPRAQFTASNITDNMVGYFVQSNWLNYTRTFPAGTYNIYGRLANGNSGLANAYLSEVIAGQGTTSQTTTPLGIFQFTGRGWNSFDFIPLTDTNGNLLAINLGGQTTLRVTCGPLGGGVNMNFFMLAPATNTPPIIANVYPDGLEPFESANALTFTVSSIVNTINQSGVQVTLNGMNVSPQLAFSGSNTNWFVSLPMPQQAVYNLTITASDISGHTNSYSESFDNFSQNDLMIEADEYDFNGGQFIDDPIETATNYIAANSYYGYPGGDPDNNAIYGEDYTTDNTNAGEVFYYRFDDAVGTQPTSDFLRNKFINTGQVLGEPVGATNNDFNVGWWDASTWLNYTRTFPTNNYYLYARFAGGVPYTNATLALVTAGQGTTMQTTQPLGTFSDLGANGYQSWHWIPLMNGGTNAIITLGDIETLKATSCATPDGDINAHFYLFVPVASAGPSNFPLLASLTATLNGKNILIKFPTFNGKNYTVYYSSSLNPPNWQMLTSTNGDGTIKTVSDTTSNLQRFYRVQAQ